MSLSPDFPTQPWDLGTILSIQEPLFLCCKRDDDSASLQGSHWKPRMYIKALTEPCTKSMSWLARDAQDHSPTHPHPLLSVQVPHLWTPWDGEVPLAPAILWSSQVLTVQPPRGGVGPSGLGLQPGKSSWSLAFCSVAGPFVFIAYRFCRGALKGCHCSSGCFRFASIKPHLMKTSLRSSFS